MTPMPQLERLTRKIQEICPELMELSFGCRVLCSPIHDNDPKDRADEYIVVNNTAMEGVEFVSLYYGGLATIELRKDELGKKMNDRFFFANEGHPITLEHCRVALSRWAWENEMSIELQENLLPELHLFWQDLQPWESQTEVHTFLEQYLLKD